jgi:hypothetical protein
LKRRKGFAQVLSEPFALGLVVDGPNGAEGRRDGAGLIALLDQRRFPFPQKTDGNPVEGQG